jgi:hypothetical protein
MPDKKYFPIKTKTACQLKWAWSTIILQGAITSSCHRVNPHTFDIDKFNFHNTPEKISQRETMLDGRWPKAGCQYCENIEKTNIGQSDRQFFLNVPNLSPIELDLNPTATIVSPTILEIYLDNLCNLGCLYCQPILSSRLDNESKKFGVFNKNGVLLDNTYQKVSNYETVLDQFWIWMQNNANTLKRINVLGGEPLFQPQFETFFEFFENNPCPNLEFNVITNLMLSKSKLANYIDKFKHLIATKKIKRLEITASIDCWGPEQEFTRYGLKLATWQENFEYLIDQQWVKLNINNTISVLTIKTLPDLLLRLTNWKKDRKIEHYFAHVVDPSYMSIGIFGADEFKEDFNKILSLMETDSWQGNHAYTYMKGIAATAQQSTQNTAEILKLITFLNEMDRRRSTKWRTTFPWLLKYENVV